MEECFEVHAIKSRIETYLNKIKRECHNTNCWQRKKLKTTTTPPKNMGQTYLMTNKTVYFNPCSGFVPAVKKINRKNNIPKWRTQGILKILYTTVSSSTFWKRPKYIILE